MPHRQRSFPFSVSEAQGAFYEEDNDAFRKRHILERRCLFIAEESQAEVAYYSPSIGEELHSRWEALLQRQGMEVRMRLQASASGLPSAPEPFYQPQGSSYYTEPLSLHSQPAFTVPHEHLVLSPVPSPYHSESNSTSWSNSSTSSLNSRSASSPFWEVSDLSNQFSSMGGDQRRTQGPTTSHPWLDIPEPQSPLQPTTDTGGPTPIQGPSSIVHLTLPGQVGQPPSLPRSNSAPSTAFELLSRSKGEDRDRTKSQNRKEKDKKSHLELKSTSAKNAFACDECVRQRKPCVKVRLPNGSLPAVGNCERCVKIARKMGQSAQAVCSWTHAQGRIQQAVERGFLPPGSAVSHVGNA